MGWLGRLLLAWVSLLSGPVWAQGAPSPSSNPGTTETERWVWERARAGEIADLHARCRVTLDPRDGQDSRWLHECRLLSADFLERAMTSDGWQAAPAHRGLRIVGARLADEVNLSGARIDMPVWLNESRFERAVIAFDAEFRGSLFMISTFEAGIAADGLSVGGSLFLRDGATVRGGALQLRGAKVEGDLDMAGSTFEVGIAADRLSVGGSVFLRGGAMVRGGALALGGAKVERDLDMDGATFEVGIQASRLSVGGGLFLRGGATVRGGALDLIGAKVEGDLDMNRSTFEVGIAADGLSVGSSLFLRNGATVRGAELSLVEAQVAATLDMTDSVFESRINAQSLAVGRSVFLGRSRFTIAPDFARVHVGGVFDLGGARLPGLILAGSTITGDLALGSGSHAPPQWTGDGVLNLRNLRAGAVEDALEDARRPTGENSCRQEQEGAHVPSAWPCQVNLRGFVYERLGGLIGGSQRDMLQRDARYYLALLARDPSPSFSRQPYQQLASVFRTAGEADQADAILYGARDREMAHAWSAGNCGPGGGLVRLEAECWRAVGMFALKITIGYGLGGGYWLALVWVGALSLVGMLVLSASPVARHKGVAWCFGASLDRLLPIIELNPEFGKFFEDPERERLKGWQLAYFSAHAVAGYALAAFVAAALAGLTQAN